MNYLSLKYSESILAFQLQFGTYEAESEHFRRGKRKTPFMGILNTLYVFKAATYVE